MIEGIYILIDPLSDVIIRPSHTSTDVPLTCVSPSAPPMLRHRLSINKNKKFCRSRGMTHAGSGDMFAYYSVWRPSLLLDILNFNMKHKSLLNCFLSKT